MNTNSKLPITRWCYNNDNQELCDELSRSLGVSSIISQILINRNITTPEKGKLFLSSSLDQMYNPNSMKDMKKGVARVVKAMKNGEKMMVCGDYDADGVTSVAVLLKFIKTAYADIDYYIPDRINEGYGLNKPTLEKMRANGVSLVITVDCGTSDYDAVVFANFLGMEVVVLDHHEVPTTLPPAHAIINPLQADCAFPFKNLAAVGIVFNFIVALRGVMRKENFWAQNKYPNLREYLDLVAIGTIGDVVPLVDENRIFIKVGLELLSSAKRTGIKALKEVAGMDEQKVDLAKSSYILIPRINAAGRIASPADAVELFLTDDINHARQLAQRLDSYNKRRQDIEKDILTDIVAEIEKIGNIANTNSFVFASKNWHPGVIGVVASRIVARFLRPAFLISIKNGIGKGSGRSFADIDLYQSLKECNSLLLSFGGHRNAAGISIKEEDIGKFSQLMEQSIANSALSVDYTERTIIDTNCSFGDVDDELITQLETLAPFGTSNSEPILCVKGVRVDTQSVVGKNHLKMRLSHDGSHYESIWYNRGNFVKTISNSTIDVAFTPQFNNWRGQNNIQLKTRDIALAI